MKVLVITYWSFKEPLIHAWTLPYLRMIREVSEGRVQLHLLTLEKEGLQMEVAESEAVREDLAREEITLITRDYHKFGFTAMRSWLSNLLLLRRYCKREGIEALHAFGSPAATTALALHKLVGIPYVIDSYEPHVESMVENGSWRKGSLAHRLLRFFERRQARTAKAVLGTSMGMRDYAAKTYGHIPRVFLHKPACVDLDRFNPEHTFAHISRASLNIPEDARVCVYAGKIGGIYLREEIFDFFAACHQKWGDAFRVLMLSDLSPDEMQRLATAAGMPPEHIVLRFVPHAEVAAHLALADFAINPVKPVPSKRYCTSIKDGEYWAMGLPVVIPEGISDDSDIVREEDIGVVLEQLHAEGYSKAVDQLEALLASASRSELITRTRQVAQRYRGLHIAMESYRKLYGPDGLMFKEEKHFLALIYNSLHDPLFSNLVYRYMQHQSEQHLEYNFHLVTFEQQKYALTKTEREATKVDLTGERIYWHPLTYHTGRFMLVKKFYDFLTALITVLRIRSRHRPDLILAFANTSAAISYVVARLFNTRLMVYSYEPHSEFLAEFGSWRRSGWRYRLLNGLEERVGREADFILTGTEHMRKDLTGVAQGEVYRAPSSVDEGTFSFRAKARDVKRAALGIGEQKVLVYAGKFGGIYYDEEIGAFCAEMHRLDPDWYFLFLSPTPEEQVRQSLEAGGLSSECYHLTEAHSADEVAEWLSAADAGLTAIPPYPNQKYRSPVKVGEYLMCGLPYITCRGVSEDDQWAEEHRVGVVVDEISAGNAEKAVHELNELLLEPAELLRLRCRETGIAYRGRGQVDALFDEILARV